MTKLGDFFKKYEIGQLFVCLTLSALLVVGILYLIFLIAPNSAYISYDAVNVQNISNVNASELSGTIATNAFMLVDFDELVFYPTHKESYNVKGTEYDSADISHIKIVPWVYSKYELEDGETFIPDSSATFYMHGDTTAYLAFSSYTSTDDTPPAVTINYLSDEYSIHFHRSFLSFFTTSDNKGGYNHDSEYINIDTGKSIEKPQPCERIQFNNCRAYLVLSDGSEVDFGEIYHSDQLYINPNNDIFVDSVTLKNPTTDDAYWQYSIIDLELENVWQFQSEASGKVMFSYTRKPAEYTLTNQVLSVCNPDNLLNMNISHFDNYNNSLNSFYVNGKVVKKAVLSENNLFPDLLTWFRENIYLAPLTLITTVYGAFSLKSKEKKRNGEANETLERELLINLNRYLQQQILQTSNNSKTSAEEVRREINS